MWGSGVMEGAIYSGARSHLNRAANEQKQHSLLLAAFARPVDLELREADETLRLLVLRKERRR